MPLRFELGPRTTPELLDSLVALWVDVSNAGGAVGFVPPVTKDDIRPDLLKHLAAMTEGRTRLLIGRDEEGAVAATAFFTFNNHPLMNHWCWLYTVMVHPSRQGKGHGRALMAAAEDAARGMDGIQGIRLTCRGGIGADRFYEACGYNEVGRVPGAIRVADDDFRDDVIMWLPLT